MASTDERRIPGYFYGLELRISSSLLEQQVRVRRIIEAGTRTSFWLIA